jgi:tol-pal system-associated acyl-CoA thioesterase
VEGGAEEQEFSLRLRVYIEDTDAGGIVYYVNYLKFMERARTEYMRSLGFGRDFIFSGESMFVVQAADVRYLQPARLDERLDVTAEPLKVGGASLLLRQSVKRGDTLLADGRIRIACVDRYTLKPRKMPAEMLARLREEQACRTRKR